MNSWFAVFFVHFIQKINCEKKLLKFLKKWYTMNPSGRKWRKVVENGAFVADTHWKEGEFIVDRRI